MKGSNNFHFKRSFSPNVLIHNKVLTSSLAGNYLLGKIGTICKNVTEPDCRDLDTVSHDNDNLIVTDDSCLILINSNNWNKGVSLQQSFSARHLWTTKSLVFKYAKLSGGTSPATAQLRPRADWVLSSHLTSDFRGNFRKRQGEAAELLDIISLATMAILQ